MVKNGKRKVARCANGKHVPWFIARRKGEPKWLTEKWKREAHEPRTYHSHHWDGKRSRPGYTF